MAYEKPQFVEIRMDAEIGSYQADYDQDPSFAEPQARPDAEAEG